MHGCFAISNVLRLYPGQGSSGRSGKAISGAQLEAVCKARGIPFETIHTSGHASIADLKRLAASVAPKTLVPIHTFGAERFPELFENVMLHQDGEWWEA